MAREAGAHGVQATGSLSDRAKIIFFAAESDFISGSFSLSDPWVV
jgi:hypothetical protein